MKQKSIILLHAFVGWAVCGATIGIAFRFTTEFNALVIHAFAVPIIFGLISLVYFRIFHYTPALKTALIFLIFTMAADFFFAALIIQKSFAMFGSLIGTWIPFALIFLTTFFVGKLVKRRNAYPAV
jgi:hypothetical protein